MLTLKFRLLGLLLLLCPVSLSAQHIWGRVLDDETGKPMAYASVKIGHKGPSTFTDLTGGFELVLEKEQPDEVVDLYITHLGFEPQEVEVHLPQDKELVVALKEKPIHVEEILVEGKALRRTAQSEVMGSLTNQLPRPENVGRIFTGIAGFDLIKRGAYAVDPVFRSFRYE